MRRSARLVDVAPVGLHANGGNLGTKLPECGWRHLIGRTIGAIDHDMQAVEPDIFGQRSLDRVDIAATRIFHTPRAPDIGRIGQIDIATGQQGFDRLLVPVGKFEAVRAEQLDTIVFIRIVAGGNHDAEIRAHGRGQHGHRRRRDGAELDHVHSHAGKSRDQRIFHHITGKARVLADDDAVLVITAQEMLAGRLPHLHRDFRCHRRTVRSSADSVRPEIADGHRYFPRNGRKMCRLGQMS